MNFADRSKEERATSGCMMLSGLLLLCIGLGAATYWYVGVIAFGVILLAVGCL